jgi:hypothetical protein
MGPWWLDASDSRETSQYTDPARMPQAEGRERQWVSLNLGFSILCIKVTN